MANRRHFKNLTRTLAVMFLAASPLCAPKMSAQRKGPSLPAPNLKAEISSLTIPRLPSAPKLDDFEGMEPATGLAHKMLKIERFIQQEPRDGAPVSQPTQAFLGYTGKNFYAVFLCFDKEPKKIRARMLRRELIDDDDQVGLWLDTFHDQRHAYYFYSNPYGIQQDGLFAESGGPDNSFDTVWHTSTKINGQGYMVMVEIPFKSLRFRRQASNSWGVILIRVIPRNSEHSFFPQNSNRIQGMLTKEGTINGLQEISPSHNIQFIPYTSVGAFRALDERDPSRGSFYRQTCRAQGWSRCKSCNQRQHGAGRHHQS